MSEHLNSEEQIHIDQQDDDEASLCAPNEDLDQNGEEGQDEQFLLDGHHLGQNSLHQQHRINQNSLHMVDSHHIQYEVGGDLHLDMHVGGDMLNHYNNKVDNSNFAHLDGGMVGEQMENNGNGVHKYENGDYYQDEFDHYHGYTKQHNNYHGDQEQGEEELYLIEEGEGQSDDDKEEDFEEMRFNKGDQQEEERQESQEDEEAKDGDKKKKKRKERTGGKDFRFSKIANCHMCKRKNKYVYGCYKNLVPTSCNKFFCIDCLINGLKENILLIIQKEDTWKCPYKRNTCQCRHCLNRKEDFQIPLIHDSDEITRLFGEAPSKKSKKNNQEDINAAKAQMKNKIKKLTDFNGQLILKMSKLQSQLSSDEIVFYNKLIHDNLTVLDNLVSKMANAGKIKEEEQTNKFHYH